MTDGLFLRPSNSRPVPAGAPAVTVSGSTNWREVVPEVESKTSDLDDAEIDGINDQAEELASELNELEDTSAESFDLIALREYVHGR